LLNLILLPSFGSRGAAAALATSIWIFFFMRTEISHHVWRKTQRSELYSWTLVALIIAVAHALAGGQAASWFSVAWGLFVAMAAINFRHSLRAGKTAAISLLRSSRNTGST
jgi:O-antigen/teichoic acid export membrane protein